MKGVAKRYSGGDKHLQEDLEQEILDARLFRKEFELQTSDLQERDLAQEVLGISCDS